jgi:hypothetical protein
MYDWSDENPFHDICKEGRRDHVSSLKGINVSKEIIASNFRINV